MANINPFFSIVIPTLNEEKFLPRLLKNLQNQTLTDFEIWVVDAESKDATLTETGKFLPYLPLKVIVSHRANTGWQRNLGARKAHGKYLLFLDADVQLPPEYLFQLRPRLMRDRPDFATTRFVPDEGKNLADDLCLGINLGLATMLTLGKPFIPGQNLIFKRRKFLALGGFDDEVVHAEDHELVQRAAKKGLAGAFYFDPVYQACLRRLKYENRWKLALKYARSTFHLLFKGPIKKPIFEYKMGGRID